MNNGICYNSNEGNRPLSEECRLMAEDRGWLLYKCGPRHLQAWFLLRGTDLKTPHRKHACFDDPDALNYQRYVIRDEDLPCNGGDAEIYSSVEVLWRAMGQPVHPVK